MDRHRRPQPPTLTRRRRTRAVAALTAVGAAAAALAAAAPVALAGPPVISGSETLDLACEPSPAANGLIELAVTVNAEGSQVVLALTDADGAVVLNSQEWNAAVTRSADRVVGTVPMVDVEGSVIGEASFTVELAVAGAPTTTTNSAQTGNVRQHSVQEIQPLGAQATVQLPNHDLVTLPVCTGTAETWTVTTTSPDALADRGPVVLNIDCLLSLGDGEVASVFIEDGVHTVTSVYVGTYDSGLGGESTDASVTQTRVSATIPVFAMGGEVPAGDAQLTLSLTKQDRDRFVLRHSVGQQAFTVETLRVNGTLRMPDGRVITVDCLGERSTAHEVATSPAGPNSTGPAPGNDAPAGALLATPGRGSHKAQTRAAVLAPEVPLWCYNVPPEDPGYLPGHTVWYRFTGTGAPITVDTAGSGFNTTLAVYAVHGDGLTELACADDRFRDSWQARATIASEPGVDYLVQVGGVGGQAGLLSLTLF